MKFRECLWIRLRLDGVGVHFLEELCLGRSLRWRQVSLLVGEKQKGGNVFAARKGHRTGLRLDQSFEQTTAMMLVDGGYSSFVFSLLLW
jgi:hypothetical protein